MADLLTLQNGIVAVITGTIAGLPTAYKWFKNNAVEQESNDTLKQTLELSRQMAHDLRGEVHRAQAENALLKEERIGLLKKQEEVYNQLRAFKDQIAALERRVADLTRELKNGSTNAH